MNRIPFSRPLIATLLAGASFPAMAQEVAPAAATPVPPVAAPAPAPPPVTDASAPVAASPQPQAPDQQTAQPAAATAPAPAGPAEGEILVTGRAGPPPDDPLSAVNETSFKAVQAVDSALVGPASKVYEKGLPRPVRKGIRGVLRNLTEPVVFVNYLLQLKPGKAAETLGRFALNSTVGIGGIIDVAAKKPFNLPYRVNGFGYTMGYYGIGTGPYLYLPLIGPTTLRDVTGRILDLSLVPTAVGKPFNTPYYSVTNGVLKSLDDRVEFDQMLRRLREECVNPYDAEREWYLATRAAEIEALHGRGDGKPAKLPECLMPDPDPASPAPVAPAIDPTTPVPPPVPTPVAAPSATPTPPAP